MGYNKPVVSEIAYKTYAINEFGMATCFLVAGEERGLLIDTGCGMYNIKEVADGLIDLPYDVVITHGHADHVMCNPLFSKIYCHPADAEEAVHPNRDMIRHYPEMMRPFGTFDVYDIKTEALTIREGEPQVIPVADGYIFDLGRRKLEVIETPGHTKGSIVLIDYNSRILFSGDACNPNLGIMATSIKTALEGLNKIKAKQQYFDRNYNGHIGYGGSNVNISMPPTTLDDCIHICKALVSGNAEKYQVRIETNTNGIFGKESAYYGAVKISYDPERIH
jgi:Zn-dependent hydrolases, including glyoxylases